MDNYELPFRTRAERQRHARRKKRIVYRFVAVFLAVGSLSMILLSGTHQEAGSPRTAEGIKEEKNTGVSLTENKAGKKGFKKPPALAESKKKPADTDPTSHTVLVNQDHPLPTGYTPPDLMIPDVPFPFRENLPKKQMRLKAGQALEKMFKEAEKQGIRLYAQSGYRSYDRQKELYAFKGQRAGGPAKQVSARPGTSEHQTGLAMDITCRSISFKLNQGFGQTKEGRWVAQHAHQYGFIIRYPKGKEEITGFTYEPWHLRYVGKKTAAEIKEKNLTLEEYYEIPSR